MTVANDTFKALQRWAWDAAACGYRGGLVELYAPVTAAMVEMLDPHPHEDLLDVATGAGEPALSLARAMNGTGTVVGIDLSDEMVSQARSRSGGQAGLEFRVMDAEALAFPDRSFDGVTCSLSLSLFASAGRALSEILRVLRPQGRVVLSAWGSERQAPFIAVVHDLLQRHTKARGAGPSPFATRDGGNWPPDLLERAGFASIELSTVPLRLRFDTFDHLWEVVARGTPIVALLQRSPPSMSETIRAALEQETLSFRQPGSAAIELANEVILVRGSKREGVSP